ncbi:MAG: hypothetical protein PHN39_03325 [Candidatus Pacebacteria bacterium]|nr:hypothetical protein [Candidatus Paceibacterota bacterium]
MNYIDLGQADDLENKKDRTLYRFFEILPGFLSCATLILAVVFSFIKPVWVAIFIILFDLYWTLKVAYLAFNQVTSFRKMQRTIKTNWRAELDTLGADWQGVYHLVFLPFVKEGWDIVSESLEALKNADYPTNQFIVILAPEGRVSEHAHNIAKLAQEHYGSTFGHFLVSIHPSDLPNEIIGKGSNVAYASLKAKELLKEKNIPLNKVIISSFDIDTKIFPQYFLCVTYHYLTEHDPHRTSFQPIPVYHNNIWEASAFTRVVATSNSFWQMMQQERPEQLVTYSSHSMPAIAFFDVGYPKNIVADDSRIFWKLFFQYNGNYRVTPLYYPLSMDVVTADSFWRTISNQYKQQRRWAWGCIEIPYIMFNFWKNKKISWRQKIFSSIVALEGFWAWACASVLILILGWLPVFLGGEGFNVTILSHNLPRLTSAIMIFAMMGMMVSAFLGILFLPPRPKNIGRFKIFFFVAQWVFLPVTLLIFGSFPALDAQIRLMLGKYLGFWATPKIRKH